MSKLNRIFKKDRNKYLLMKVSSIAAVIVLLFAIFSLIYFFSTLNFEKELIVNGKTINFDIAYTPEEKAKGLGDRNSMPSDYGLLFAYDEYIIPSFWMKDMKFPIDIIWIKDNMVIGTETDLTPQPEGSRLPLYQPKTFVNYVLEVNSGFVSEHNIIIGDRVEIPL